MVISRHLHVDGRTACIGILSKTGLRALRRNGHEAVAAACAHGLRPDDVRFVDLSKLEALETTSDAELAVLYAAPFPARPFVSATRAAEAQAATIDLRVQPDLGCLRGHFPALPIVPGAAQLGWVLEFGAEMLGTSPTMGAVRSVKFERIIQPGRSLRLHIVAESGTSTLRFEYASEMGKHSAGRIETRVGDD